MHQKERKPQEKTTEKKSNQGPGSSDASPMEESVRHDYSDIRIPHIEPAIDGKDYPDLPETLINPVDGAQMILIPAGEFIMGASPEDPEALDNEKPRSRVYLDSYYIYKYEVTFGMFRRFAESTGYISNSAWERFAEPRYDDYPVINVNFIDVASYCRWAGVTLPTEAQWEKAAGGTDGRLYPWGNQWDPDRCNNIQTKEPDLKKRMIPIIPKHGTLPVGSIIHDKSPFGVMDMGGNINEWCYDWYDADYRKNAPARNPTGPPDGRERVVKGGSWSLSPERCRISARWSGSMDSSLCDYGFRCAAPAGMGHRP